MSSGVLYDRIGYEAEEKAQIKTNGCDEDTLLKELSQSIKRQRDEAMDWIENLSPKDAKKFMSAYNAAVKIDKSSLPK
jgi:hypothetical protein